MKLEQSRGSSSSDGLAALALVTALINNLPVGRQRRLLAEASVLLPDLPGTNRDEAHRIIHAMRAQIAH
jgi:hypothetical protein